MAARPLVSGNWFPWILFLLASLSLMNIRMAFQKMKEEIEDTNGEETKATTKKLKLPIFNSAVIPGSMCHPDSLSNIDVISYCKEIECMQHRKDVDNELVHLPQVDIDINSDAKGCKMLWFTAQHETEGMCDGKHHAYNVDYSVALNSFLSNAKDTLQPVLILGRYGTSYENSTEPTKLASWAEERGAKVVYSPRLSFQEDVDNGKGLPFAFTRQGPFLRIDIPKFIKEYNLLDMPNVCKDHVLYTDTDVVFTNPFTHKDVQTLQKLIGDGMVLYGREYGKHAHIQNTGVMLMNVNRFEQEIPKILHSARNEKEYPSHDQFMLNWYKTGRTKDMFKLLPMHYNWKAYWGLEPSNFSEVKILHFHGPKLGRGLEEMSACNISAVSPEFHTKDYTAHIQQGICCDQGRTARWSLEAIDNLRAPIEDLCEVNK